MQVCLVAPQRQGKGYGARNPPVLEVKVGTTLGAELLSGDDFPR